MALKLNRPPNTCMPRSAKIIMKRKRRSSREAMDWMELRSDATRLESDRQYLEEKEASGFEGRQRRAWIGTWRRKGIRRKRQFLVMLKGGGGKPG